jgi:hypothetical protein
VDTQADIMNLYDATRDGMKEIHTTLMSYIIFLGGLS